jgi:flavin-dependent dehydrogenase
MAAIRLARAGASVTLFDHTHPREKPCGGGITARALALAGEVIDLASLPAVVVRSASIEASRSSAGDDAAAVDLVDGGMTAKSSLVVTSRAAFDALLVDAARRAGAGWVPEKVLGVSRHHQRFTIRTAAAERRADFVLGADGANSLVRKTFWRPFSRADLSIAAGYFVHGVTSTAITVKPITEPPGYLWSFPRPDHLAVGICCAAAERTSSVELVHQSLAWIHRHVAGTPVRLQPYAWPIPSAAHGGRAALTRSAGPGWLLLGDAAGLVDPLTREGIFYALVSGQWAAEALAASPGRAAQLYTDRLVGQIYPELRRAADLAPMFFSPGFSTLLIDALHRSASIRRIFVDLVEGRSYRGLRRRLLSTREWGLASRAARLALQARRGAGIGGTINENGQSPAASRHL